MGGKYIVVILHIHGAVAIFILFCDHKDTESESCEMDIGVTGPIFPKKMTSKDLWDVIYILYKMGENILVILHIY